MKRVLFFLMAIIFAIQGFGQAPAATLPYSCDFESASEKSDWILSNSTCVNRWVFGSGVNAPGFLGTSLFISNNSTANAYSVSASSLVTATRKIVSSGASMYQLSFDFSCYGESSYDYVKVYILPKDSSYVGFAPLTNPPGFPYYAINSYTNPYLIAKNGTNNYINMVVAGRFYYNVPASLMGVAGDTVNLVFVWKNDEIQGYQPPAAIDNISLVGTSCPSPTLLDIPIENITTTSATVNWTSDPANTSFTLEYKIDTQSWANAIQLQNVSSGVVLNNLNPITNYSVRLKANCSSTESFWLTKNFTTSCYPVTTFPYYEGFENTTWKTSVLPGNATSPQCWININSGTTTGLWKSTNSTSYIRTGLGAAQMYSGSSSTTTQHGDYLITPVLTLTGNQYLRFWSKGYSTYADTLAVAIYSLSANTHDFYSATDTLLMTYIMTPIKVDANKFLEYEIDLNSYVGDFRIAFVRNTKGGYYLNIDDISIDNYPSCRRPKAVSTSNTTNSSVDISFTPGLQGDASWYLYYKNIYQVSYDSILLSTYPYTLTGLSPSSTYTYYLKTYCGTNLSEATNPTTFKTSCGTITNFPWSEGFEQALETTVLSPGNALAPYCWLNFNGGTTTGKWGITTSSSYIYTGIGAAQMNTSTTAQTTQHNDWLISPMVKLTGNQLLRFWAKGYSTYKDSLEIRVYNATTMQRDVLITDTTSNFITAMPRILIPADPFTEYEVDLSQFIGDCRIAFVRNSKGGYYLNLDDVKIVNASTCKRPRYLMDTTTTESTATIKFTPGTPADNAWYLYYNNISTSVWDSVLITSNPYTLTNLTPNTPYQYYIKTVCIGLISEPSNISKFRTECSPISTLPYFENFDSYGVGAFSNWNYCWYRKSTYQPTSYPNLASGIYNSAPASVYFTANTGTYNLIATQSIDPNVAPINTLRVKFKLYIQNSSYSGVEVGVMNNSKDSSSFVKIGSTVGNNSYGVWEDKEVSFASYTGTGTYIAFRNIAGTSTNSFYIDDVKIEFLPQCAAPNNLLSTSVYHNQANIAWAKANISDSAWWIYYKPINSTQFDSVYVKSNPYVLTNLLPQTIYNYYIITSCGSDISSPSSTYTFTTKCSPVTIPYYEQFDTYGTGTSTYPTCWSRISTYSSNFPYLDSYYKVSSPASLYFSASSSTYTLGVMPAIDSSITMNSLIASFSYRNTQLNSTGIRVGVMSNPDDISTFYPIGGYYLPKNTNSFDTLEVSLVNYQGTGRYIALLCEGKGSANYFNIDDFRIDSIPSCAKVTDISVDSITTNSAKIKWSTGNINNTSWWLYYKSAYATNYDSVYIQSLTSYNLINLNPSTQYQYYFVTSCSPTNSLPTVVKSFYTACSSISSFPWSEGFENSWMPKIGISNDNQPTNCWININLQSISYKWQKNTSNTIPAYVRTGTGAAQSYNGSNQLMADYLMTPIFTFNGNQKIVFWSKGFSSTTLYPENLWIKAYNVTANGDIDSISDTTQFINIGFINDTNCYTWREYEYALTNLVGDYRIVFARINNVGYTCNIDDLKIVNQAACPRPISVNILNIQAHQANISWISGTPNDNAWEIYYRQIGKTQWDSIQVTTNPYTLNNLLSNTSYEIEVKTVCASGGFSDSKIGSFITACDPITSFPYYEGFESVWQPANGISNSDKPTNCWINVNKGDDLNYCWKANTIVSNVRTGFGSANLYGVNSFMGDYLLTPVLTLTGNQKLVFWAKGTASTIVYPENVWIKAYNVSQNGDFDAYTDTVLMTNIAFINDTNQYTWKEYELPLTGLTGNYRLVFARNNAIGYNYYIDDLKVDNIPTCARPTSVAVSNIQQTQVNVSWVSGNVADNSWSIFYRKSGTLQWDSVLVSTNPYTLTGLSPITLYDIEVKTDCGLGTFSDSREGGTFYTACGQISSLPWNESFDSYKTTGTTVVPNCWVRNSTQANRPNVQSGGFYGNGLYFYSAVGAYSLIIAPEFALTIPLNTIKLNLKFKPSTANVDTLRIGIMSDTTIASWVEYTKITGNNLYNDYQIDFSSYTGTSNKIAFKIQSGSGHIDNVVFSHNITCSDPTLLTANTITQTAATITWTPGGTEANWQIKLGSTGTPIDVQTPSYSFSGLTHNTSYTAYVRASCTGGLYSSWVPVTFTTLLMPSNPVVSTSNVTTFTYSTATLVGSYTQWLDTVNAVGFEYKTSAATSWTNQALSTVASPFSYNASGLTPSTLYKVRAYATTKAGNFYGDTVTFTTAAFNLPIVTTDSVQVYYGNTTAKFYGAITQGTESIIARGFEYKTASQDWSLAQDLTATGTNTITATATGLVSGANYDVRAYAETQSGKTYGAEKNFNATSGINDIEVNTMSVSLYPNPASTTSTLVVRGIVAEAKVIITDVQGRTINTFTMKSINGEATKAINVNDFAKGVYYLRIQNVNTISTEKLIIR